MTKRSPSHRGDGRRKDDGSRRALVLGGIAAAAAAGFGALAAAVARRDTARADEKVRKRTSPRRGHPAREAADAISPVGKWWTYIPAALAASAYVVRADGAADGDAERSRRAGAGAITLAGVVATALNHAFDRVLPQPPAPPGRPSRRKPVFPSGHAFGAAFWAGSRWRRPARRRTRQRARASPRRPGSASRSQRRVSSVPPFASMRRSFAGSTSLHTRPHDAQPKP
ncbi:MAG TPA: hypothetical protein VF092_30250 [Longimicrobium sp.]